MTPREVAGLPAAPGVYRFRDARGRVLYIGRATALRSRVASYWSGLRDRGHLAPMVARVARIEAVSCDSAHEAAWLERNLLEASLPPWNRTPGGQETLVYLRLDERASRPGLTVEHRPRPARDVCYFGPYLGGLRVRQAVTGLNRVLPLSYAGAGLRGARLDLARARGLAGVDPAELVRVTAAVLDRQPDAVGWVRGELARLRDRAAAALAFELAARLRDELRSLEWVTCPQRVTCMDGGNFDACGWSGGVLLRFGIRDGRLREWSQHGYSQARAEPWLAATPAGWAGFTRRNAELAADLLRRGAAGRAGTVPDRDARGEPAWNCCTPARSGRSTPTAAT